MKPLSKMTREKQIFRWSAEARKSFKEIKEDLARKPKLCLPDY